MAINPVSIPSEEVRKAIDSTLEKVNKSLRGVNQAVSSFTLRLVVGKFSHV